MFTCDVHSRSDKADESDGAQLVGDDAGERRADHLAEGVHRHHDPVKERQLVVVLGGKELKIKKGVNSKKHPAV